MSGWLLHMCAWCGLGQRVLRHSIGCLPLSPHTPPTHPCFHQRRNRMHPSSNQRKPKPQNPAEAFLPPIIPSVLPCLHPLHTYIHTYCTTPYSLNPFSHPPKPPTYLYSVPDSALYVDVVQSHFIQFTLCAAAAHSICTTLN